MKRDIGDYKAGPSDLTIPNPKIWSTQTNSPRLHGLARLGHSRFEGVPGMCAQDSFPVGRANRQGKVCRHDRENAGSAQG